MRHLTFYFAIGFLIVGCLMLFTSLSVFIGRISQNEDVAGSAVLGLAMLLPFLIAGFSWRDWEAVKGGKHTRENEPRNLTPALVRAEEQELIDE